VILYAGTPAGLFRSLDGGQTWRDTSLRLSVLSIAVDPRDSDNVYAGTERTGVFRSSDGGAIPAERVTALAIDPARLNTLYAAFATYFPRIGTLVASGIRRSQDRGDTWAYFKPAIPEWKQASFGLWPSIRLAAGFTRLPSAEACSTTRLWVASR
jgi:hypothetical protein